MSARAIEVVVGIESRGFILGAAVAERIKAGFIPIRKPGKLPSKTLKESYSLEYGMDSLEVHEDAIENGHKVLIVDDVLATGRHGGRRGENGQEAGRGPAGAGVPDRAAVPERPVEAGRREGLLGPSVLSR